MPTLVAKGTLQHWWATLFHRESFMKLLCDPSKEFGLAMMKNAVCKIHTNKHKGLCTLLILAHIKCCMTSSCWGATQLAHKGRVPGRLGSQTDNAILTYIGTGKSASSTSLALLQCCHWKGELFPKVGLQQAQCVYLIPRHLWRQYRIGYMQAASDCSCATQGNALRSGIPAFRSRSCLGWETDLPWWLWHAGIISSLRVEFWFKLITLLAISPFWHQNQPWLHFSMNRGSVF